VTIVKVNEPLAVFSGTGPLGDLPPLPLPPLPGRGDLPPLPGRGDLPGCGAAPLGDFFGPRALFTIASGDTCQSVKFSDALDGRMLADDNIKHRTYQFGFRNGESAAVHRQQTHRLWLGQPLSIVIVAVRRTASQTAGQTLPS
jgi:hypothetical protein